MLELGEELASLFPSVGPSTVPGRRASGRHADPGEHLWREIAATLPASATVCVAMVPWVVELASRVPPSRRLQHVAFVADLAFGGVRDAADVEPSLADACYERTTATVHRLVREAVAGTTWEAWEAQCLVAACTRIAGRLRRPCTTERPRPRSGPPIRTEELELASWLAEGSHPGPSGAIGTRPGRTVLLPARCARVREPRRMATADAV